MHNPRITQKEIDRLFEEAQKHQIEHVCSAHPYENGTKLVHVIEEYSPNSILEIGTGIGYTATIMAMAAPMAHIETLEKDGSHATMAADFVAKHGVISRVQIINASAEIYLPSVVTQYDFIFFDGFQIHYEFLPQYERLLKPQGILFLGNNHLKSKTSDQFFAGLNDAMKWEMLDQFAETKVMKRLPS